MKALYHSIFMRYHSLRIRYTMNFDTLRHHMKRYEYHVNKLEENI